MEIAIEDLKKMERRELLHKLFGRLDKWKREIEDIVQPDIAIQSILSNAIDPKLSKVLIVYYKKDVARKIVEDLKKLCEEVL